LCPESGSLWGVESSDDKALVNLCHPDRLFQKSLRHALSPLAGSKQFCLSTDLAAREQPPKFPYQSLQSDHALILRLRILLHNPRQFLSLSERLPAQSDKNNRG